MVTFRNVNFLKQTLLEYYSHEPGIAKISGACMTVFEPLSLKSGPTKGNFRLQIRALFELFRGTSPLFTFWSGDFSTQK